jgi:hypothetical protein
LKLVKHGQHLIKGKSLEEHALSGVLGAECKELDNGSLYPINVCHAWRDVVPGDAFRCNVASQG